MKFYIIYHSGISNSGYYVGYKNKLSDNYSDSYLLAKKYITLGPVLSRIGVNHKKYDAIATIRFIHCKINDSLLINRRRKLAKLNDTDFSFKESDINSIDILNGHKIEIIEIDGNNIIHLGKLSNLEIYNFIKKEANKFVSNVTELEYKLPSTLDYSLPTLEDIDDFCSHVDNILSKSIKINKL